MNDYHPYLLLVDSTTLLIRPLPPSTLSTMRLYSTASIPLHPLDLNGRTNWHINIHFIQRLFIDCRLMVVPSPFIAELIRQQVPTSRNKFSYILDSESSCS